MKPFPTPAEIARQAFAVSPGGYDPQDVRRFLGRLAREISRLEGEIEGQRARIRILEEAARANKDEAYRRISERFSGAIRSADEAADRMRADADEEARKILSSARDEAAAIVAAARRKVERLHAEARDPNGRPEVASATALSKASVEVELDAVQRQLGSVASMIGEIDVADGRPGDGEATAGGHDDVWAASTDGRGGAPAT